MNLNTPMVDAGKIIAQFLLDVLYFPLWWYSRGLIKLLAWSGRFLSARQKGLALGIWAKNIFTPMYGQRDWAGMLISFITRFLQIIVRSIAMLFWLLIVLIIIIFWLGILPAVIYEMLFQLIRP